MKRDVYVLKEMKMELVTQETKSKAFLLITFIIIITIVVMGENLKESSESNKISRIKIRHTEKLALSRHLKTP